MRIAHTAFLLALSAVVPTGTIHVANAADKGGAKMICKTQPKLGSRFGTRTCHTKAEWDAIREAALQSASEMANRNIDVARPRDGDENLTMRPQ